VAGGWVLLYLHPGDNWLVNHVRSWSDDVGIEGVVADLSLLFPAIAFALGLMLGLTFDTSGPRVRKPETVITAPPREQVVEEEPVVGAGAAPEAQQQARD
jgi:hypothetical protein